MHDRAWLADGYRGDLLAGQRVVSQVPNNLVLACHAAGHIQGGNGSEFEDSGQLATSASWHVTKGCVSISAVARKSATTLMFDIQDIFMMDSTIRPSDKCGPTSAHN